MWSWMNWLADKARDSGKRLLLINLDETSIPTSFPHTGGNVMLLDPTKNWLRAPRQHATRAERRSYFTHVGLICNDVAIQPKLPQVIFVAEKLLSQAAWAAIQPGLPDNVYVKRMVKGWNNAQEHAVIIRLLGQILAPVLDTCQPVLMFDAVGLHLADEIMLELTVASMWYLVIPARLTWLLQPLDTHGFAKYKRYLRNRFQETVAGAEEANLTQRMVQLVVQTIRAVLNGNRWAPAFVHNGLDGSQANVSKYIKQLLKYEVLPQYPRERPTVDALRLCWPRNRVVRDAIVFQPLPDPDPVVGMLALPAPPPAAPPLPPVVETLALGGLPSATFPLEHVGGSSGSAAASAATPVEGIHAAPLPEPAAGTARQRLRGKTSSSQ